MRFDGEQDCDHLPVRLHGADLGVVVVVSSIICAFTTRDCPPEKKRKDAVTDLVRLVLVKRDQDKRVVHEVLVGHKRLEEVPRPLPGDSDGRVVAVIGHVRSDKHPLWEIAILQVIIELRKVLLIGEPARASVDVVEDRRVVLTNIVVGTRLLVDPRETFEPGVWHVLLVRTPGDTLIFEQVGDARNVGDDLIEVVVVHAKVVTPMACTVVRLGWMRHAEVVGQCDGFGGQPGHVGIRGGFIEVGVFEPDDYKAVESSARDMALRPIVRCSSRLSCIDGCWARRGVYVWLQ